MNSYGHLLSVEKSLHSGKFIYMYLKSSWGLLKALSTIGCSTFWVLSLTFVTFELPLYLTLGYSTFSYFNPFVFLCWEGTQRREARKTHVQGC